MVIKFTQVLTLTIVLSEFHELHKHSQLDINSLNSNFFMCIFNNCNIYNFFMTTNLQADYRKSGLNPLISNNYRW